MVIIRPVASSDLDDILALASLTGFGLTTLPQDPKWLANRIRDSERGFLHLEGSVPRGDFYLFVMEDLMTSRVIGTCGIVSKIGGFEPFYAYQIQTSVHKSEMLGVHKEIPTLHLVTEHNGPCEIGSLFLAPDYRKSGNGRLLSMSRFLFIAEHPESFDSTVVAEMRGVIDDRGQSAFWDAIGKHFFEIDFPKADYLSILNKKFIADLMPRHPIYVPLLPTAAQTVIGQVHEQTRPALRLLEEQGFRWNGMVDIFEAGPVISCPRDQIRPVKESKLAVIGEIRGDIPDAPICIIARCVGDFRVVSGPLLELPGDRVRVPADIAEAMGVKPGDQVRYVLARSGPSKEAK